MENSVYKVKTEIFEGPLDLLLSLIEKRKLFINDISLAKVTDDFIEYTQKLENFSIGESANFILIASTLMLIKSKSILPTLSFTEEEEYDIKDLEERLKIYKRIKELSINIEENFGKNIIFQKSQSKITDPIFSPTKEISVQNIFLHAKNILVNLPKKELVPKVLIRKVISLEETINKLTKRIQANLTMSFKEFSGGNKAEKINIIVSFLAMLELVKIGTIAVMQNSNFGDIDMESQEIATPNYN